MDASLCIENISGKDRKRKRGLFASSTFYRVSPNTLTAYTSKSPRRISDVSVQTFTLAVLLKLAISIEQE